MRYIRIASAVLVAAVFLAPSLSHAITVGPAKVSLSVDPGQSVSGTLYLKNDGGDTATFYPLVQRFSESSDGQKVFSNDPKGLATWFQLPASVTLKGGEDAQIPYTMVAPPDAAPGGHFGVLWWSTAPPSGGQVSIVTRAGILLYVRVSSNIVEKAHVASFAADPRFGWGLPVNFDIDFVDDGNVALNASGDIRITNMFGALKTVLPVNPYGGITLPGTNEAFRSVWTGSGFFFSIYHATLNLHYGDSNQLITRSTWFVVVSPLAAGIVLFIIFLGFVAPPLLRKYNRWIIERAKRS